MTAPVIYPQPVPTEEPYTFHIHAPNGAVFECDAFYNVRGEVTELCVAGETGAVVTEELVAGAFRNAEAMGKLCGAFLNRPDQLVPEFEPAPRPEPPAPPTLEELGQGNLFDVGDRA
jgi:hypothetical protein